LKKQNSDSLAVEEAKINDAKNFVPKENSKIDYKPEALTYFVVATVGKADKIPKEKGDKGTPTQYNLKINYSLDGQTK
jgi:hypothetical protein